MLEWLNATAIFTSSNSALLVSVLALLLSLRSGAIAKKSLKSAERFLGTLKGAVTNTQSIPNRI